jgi:hypothetical protein
VSSDLILALLTDLDPSERGLVRDAGSAVWRFEANYPRRLQSSKQATDAALAMNGSAHR